MRADRHCLTCSRVTAEPVPFVASFKASEPRNQDVFAPLKRADNLGKHRLEQPGGGLEVQSVFSLNQLGKLCAGYGHDTPSIRY